METAKACQRCGRDGVLTITIGEYTWCRLCVHRAMEAGAEQHFASQDATHGEVQREKKLKARETALKDFNRDTW